MRRSGFGFRLRHIDAGSGARLGVLSTPRGEVHTPAFMPVGTCATVKGLTIDQVRATGAEMVLGNTYHLALRPGSALIQELGGLHSFMGWNGPILTDSGGFQLYSLAKRTRVTDAGAVFRSHIDGQALELSPERAVAIQEELGSDIAMVLDHVIALPATHEQLADAVRRTVLWAARSREASRRADQVLFCIVQGGLDAGLRARCAEQLVSMDFDGYAIGGLSVGESPEEMYLTLDATCPALPAHRPRYLMGVGRPIDLLESIARGVDLFDCVLPTRNGRNAMAFTDSGPLRLRNKRFERDARPLDEECPCPACCHSRAYLRHLFMTDEMLGPVLLSAHNLTFYQRLLRDARGAILANRYAEFFAEQAAKWQPGEPASEGS